VCATCDLARIVICRKIVHATQIISKQVVKKPREKSAVHVMKGRSVVQFDYSNAHFILHSPSFWAYIHIL
jgi:hypothetical protein